MAENEKKVVKTDEKPAKTTKPAKEKNKGKVKEAWKGFKSELKKIVWPSWKQVLKNTGIVLVIILICSLAIIALDYAFNGGIMALTNLITDMF